MAKQATAQAVEYIPTKHINPVSIAFYRTWRSQREAALEFGIRQKSVGAWLKNGRVSLDYLEHFCRRTGIRPEDANPRAHLLRHLFQA